MSCSNASFFLTPSLRYCVYSASREEEKAAFACGCDEGPNLPRYSFKDMGLYLPVFGSMYFSLCRFNVEIKSSFSTTRSLSFSTNSSSAADALSSQTPFKSDSIVSILVIISSVSLFSCFSSLISSSVTCFTLPSSGTSFDSSSMICFSSSMDFFSSASSCNISAFNSVSSFIMVSNFSAVTLSSSANDTNGVKSVPVITAETCCTRNFRRLLSTAVLDL
mmetsp:Transcript_9814/g.22110  ORF Transcript_9814/g.22110 Transcript_9814/m.22110 type:complete len:220 (+) Transcript_9814:1725-2384(+)